MSNVIQCLKERGLVDAMTSEELFEKATLPLKVYAGFDPTADSLHLGNLVTIVVLGWFQRFGHTPVIVLGGATARIGDPSGKSVERPLLDQASIVVNIAGIRKHFEAILDVCHPTAAPLILNNDKWLSNYLFIDFLRDIGKHFRLGTMLAKESVRSRLHSEEGISFTEFSYQLLQAYDFYYLRNCYGVTLQIGGSDQWGNITSGVELIRRLSGETAYGLTFPLLTRSDGKKFGKTEEGTVWLAPEKVSPYEFYQYLVRVPDGDVIRLMRMVTFMDLEEIASYEAEMSSSSYVPNSAQKRLAEEITRMIHGEEGLEMALRVTQQLSPGTKAVLDVASLKELMSEMPHVSLSSAEVLGCRFVDICTHIGLVTSKGEATRLVANGGAYLNNDKIQDPHLRITAEHLIGEKYLLFSAGKKKKMLVSIH